MSDTVPLSLRLHRMFAAHDRARARWRRELGLSAYEQVVLHHVCLMPLTIGELGRSVALSPAAMTGLSDRLEHSGHVERSRDSRDRRRVVLRATDRACDDINKVIAPVADVLTDVLSTFPEHEQQAIETFLTRVEQTFDSHAREKSDRIAEMSSSADEVAVVAVTRT